MTAPHPVAGWIQLTVSPQRHVVARQRRRRRALLMMRAGQARSDQAHTGAGPVPGVPAQRRPEEATDSRSTVWRRV